MPIPQFFLLWDGHLARPKSAHPTIFFVVGWASCPSQICHVYLPNSLCQAYYFKTLNRVVGETLLLRELFRVPEFDCGGEISQNVRLFLNAELRNL